MLPCFITQNDPKGISERHRAHSVPLGCPEPARLNFTHYIFRLCSHLSEYGNFQQRPFEILRDDIFGMREAYLERAPVTVTY